MYNNDDNDNHDTNTNNSNNNSKTAALDAPVAEHGFDEDIY